jgi:outer membrane protein OmpA-like peptidoglycan-associated protein
MKNLLIILTLIAAVNSLAQTEKRTFNCYFDFNQADFPQDSVVKLLNWMRSIDGKVETVTLRGYTDSVGTQSYNYKLADKRLKAISSQLMRGYYGKIRIEDSKGEVYQQAYGPNDQQWRKVEVGVTYVPTPIAVEIPPVEIIEDKPQIVKDNPKIIEEIPESKVETKEERIETFSKAKGAISLQVQFYGGTDTYMGNAAADVEALAAYLNEHPEVDAFIRGHVCCQNDVVLSQRRAKKVYQDLIALGISKRRLKYEGFGNTMPLAQEVDEYTMQQNRRVDVVFTPEK